jgi:ribonuclease BN (tRNA processing enzyme)
MTEEFDFRTLAPQMSFDLGPFRTTVERTVHPVEAYAIRLEHDGKILTYSGDSGTCEPLVRLAKDSDLFLCEASFLDPHNAPEVHLSGREAAEHASRAGAGRLVITHVPPWHSSALTMAEAAPHFDGTLDLAQPGAVFTI